MDPDVIKLFGVMTAIMIPLALAGGVYFLVTSFVRRLPRSRTTPEPDELQDLRERVEELERREARVQEIEERLDFLERVLPRVREGPAALESPRAPKEKTPV